MRRHLIGGLLIGLSGCKSISGDRASLEAPYGSFRQEGERPLNLTSGPCAAPEFTEGKFYTLGTKVTYKGLLYEAVHEDNAGYDPSSWGWFWRVERRCQPQLSIGP
jgi:hypothetical protein